MIRLFFRVMMGTALLTVGVRVGITIGLLISRKFEDKLEKNIIVIFKKGV